MDPGVDLSEAVIKRVPDRHESGLRLSELADPCTFRAADKAILTRTRQNCRRTQVVYLGNLVLILRWLFEWDRCNLEFVVCSTAS
jgi:hypothetical protein